MICLNWISELMLTLIELRSILLVIFILLIITWSYMSSITNLPPGPWGLPLVGYLPFVGNPPHIKLQEVAKKYGPICSFYLGSKLVILMNDYEVIKEALIKKGDIFSGRPESFPFRVFRDDIGIVTTEGNEFRAFKSFIVSTLKDAGAVKKTLELIVRDNTQDFVKRVKGFKGESVNILESLGLSVAQTYCFLLLGKRYDPDNEWFRSLIYQFYLEQRAYDNGIRIYLPWTRRIPVISNLVGEDNIRKIKKEIHRLLEEIVVEQENTYQEGSRETFVHAWITERENRRKKDPNDALFSRKHLLHNMDVVFAAGYETTTTTLLWFLIFLMKYPEVQKRIRKEIDDVIGEERVPSISDADNMPYTQAAISETHRCATIGPLGLLHCNRQTTTLSGYTIPNRSYILSNQLNVHMDPKYFPEPEKFKPERFIDATGKFMKCEQILAFSAGKRQCPGEPLAQVEIFLYVTTLLQNFFLIKPDDEEFSMDRSPNLSANPKPFKIRFMPR